MKNSKFSLSDLKNSFKRNKKDEDLMEFETRKPTLGFFFKLLFRKFAQLLQLNLLMLFMVIPIIVVVFVFLLGEKTPTATSPLYASLYGISQVTQSAEVAHLLDMSSVQMNLPVFSPFVNILFLCMGLLLALTWGWQNVGATYVLRGLFRGDAVFVFSDYFYAIKKNLKQGFFMGLIDFIICAILIYDFTYFYNQTGDFMIDVMYFVTFALLLIYIVMRFYLYTQLVTFDLKIFKIFKNALIFTPLGIKRNILAFLGIVLLIALHIFLIFLFIPIGISIPIVLPFVYILSVLGFMAMYAAYPVIEKYMITPYDSADTDAEEIES